MYAEDDDGIGQALMGQFEATFKAVLKSKKPPHVSSSSQPHAYASEALRCARWIQYRIQFGGEVEEEVDLRSQLAFHLGDYIHGIVQESLGMDIASFQDEVRWDAGTVSGRADGLLTREDGAKVVVEIKSMEPDSFAMRFREEAPSPGHLMQGMLSTLHLDAEYVWIIYVNKAAKTQNPAVLLQWTLPAYKAEAELEMRRLDSTVKLAMEGYVVPRLHEGEMIKDPTKTRWPCNYCPFKDRCIVDGPGDKPFKSHAVPLPMAAAQIKDRPAPLLLPPAPEPEPIGHTPGCVPHNRTRHGWDCTPDCPERMPSLEELLGMG